MKEHRFIRVWTSDLDIRSIGLVHPVFVARSLPGKTECELFAEGWVYENSAAGNPRPNGVKIY